MKKFPNGIFKVKITDITYGESEMKKTPYFLCKFENGIRYIEERVHLTKESGSYIKMLFAKVGLYPSQSTVENLIDRELWIEVVSGKSCKNDGSIVSYGKVGKIYSLLEMEEIIAKREFYECFDDENDVTSYADIFGVDMREMASDMGIDPSEINEDMIMEYSGY